MLSWDPGGPAKNSMTMGEGRLSAVGKDPGRWAHSGWWSSEKTMLLVIGKFYALFVTRGVEDWLQNFEERWKLKLKSEAVFPEPRSLVQSFPSGCQPGPRRGTALAPGKLGLRPNSRTLGADWQPLCLSNLGDPEKRMNIRVPEQNQ